MKHDQETPAQLLGMLRASLNACWELMRADPNLDADERSELLEAARTVREWAVSRSNAERGEGT